MTKSIWRFPTASAKRIGHPAPFPIELPRRTIEFYTFAGDVVLDPFMGSGSTALAAKQTGRQFIGFDISNEFIELAKKEFQIKTSHSPEFLNDLNQDRLLIHSFW